MKEALEQFGFKHVLSNPSWYLYTKISPYLKIDLFLKIDRGGRDFDEYGYYSTVYISKYNTNYTKFSTDVIRLHSRIELFTYLAKNV